MAESQGVVADRLLTVGQVAGLLGTTERFPRRLIAERRIEFVKIGRYVRIRESALMAFIDAGRVDVLTIANIWPRRKGAA